MNSIKKFFSVCLFLVFGSVISVFGCMCGKISIDTAFAEADAVIIAELLNYKETKIPRDFISVDGEPNIFDVGQSVTLKIDKWFKGKGSNIITLTQPNSTCDWQFNEDNRHKKYLFYLNYTQKYKKYSIVSCGRSAEVKKAGNDLSWLNNLPKSLMRTRISGTTRFYADDNEDDEFYDLPSIKLLISGQNVKYELTSDKKGLYEIWDVPIGEYFITASYPTKYKLSWTSSVPDNNIFFWNENMRDDNALKVTINPKINGGIDFMFEERK